METDNHRQQVRVKLYIVGDCSLQQELLGGLPQSMVEGTHAGESIGQRLEIVTGVDEKKII